MMHGFSENSKVKEGINVCRDALNSHEVLQQKMMTPQKNINSFSDNNTISQLKDTREIELILNEYNYYFNPILSDVLNLREYANKLSKFSQFIVLKNPLGNILGFAAYYRNDPTKKLSFITLLTVNKKFRKCGYGSLLLEYVISDARNNGFGLCQLEVRNDNDIARHLYEKHGFIYAGKATEHSHFMNITLNLDHQ